VNYPQFEAKKIAMKQTKDGYVMSLAIHPDDIPDEIVKDFVGARYMVVMVRLGDEEKPLNREEYAGGQMVKLAGMLCRDSTFWEYLYQRGEMWDKCEKNATEFLYTYLNITSRSDLKTNLAAQKRFKALCAEYKEWNND
jgi:hypothetical protein